MQLACDTNALASSLLVSHIDLTGRVVTHQYCGQTRRHATFFDKLGDFRLDFALDLLSNPFSIK